jgi:hypothetical protein
MRDNKLWVSCHSHDEFFLEYTGEATHSDTPGGLCYRLTPAVAATPSLRQVEKTCPDQGPNASAIDRNYFLNDFVFIFCFAETGMNKMFTPEG